MNVEEGPWDTRWVKVAKKEDPNREREGKEEGEGCSTFEGRRVSGERASFISRRKWIEKKLLRMGRCDLRSRVIVSKRRNR